MSASAASVKRPKPVVLLILDGWGHREDPADNALAQAEPILWMSYVPLAPLFLLFVTGVYLFALPYFARRRQRNQG